MPIMFFFCSLAEKRRAREKTRRFDVNKVLENQAPQDQEQQDKEQQDITPMTGVETPSHCRPTLAIDWDVYAQYLEDAELSDAQKRELLETLWSIIVSFVDLGFGLHPIQQACEQPLDLSQLESSDVLRSMGPLPHKAFAKAADHLKKDHADKRDHTERSAS